MDAGRFYLGGVGGSAGPMGGIDQIFDMGDKIHPMDIFAKQYLNL